MEPNAHDRGRPTAAGADCGAAAQLEGLIRRAIDPLQLMQRVADQAQAMIEAADGVLVGLIIDRDCLRYVCGSGYLNNRVGEPLPLAGSLSGEAIRTRTTLVVGDSESDTRVNRAATRAFNVRSSVCVPLGRGEQAMGILNVSSAVTDAFDEQDVELLSGLADFIGIIIGVASEFTEVTARLLSVRRPHSPGPDGGGRAGRRDDVERAGRFVVSVLDPAAARELDERAQIERIIDRGDYRVVLQPIFDLCGGGVVAAEALARFAEAGSPPPDVWFARAHRVGLGVELELALFEAALASLAQLPCDVLLAVNAGPQALASARIAQALRGVDATRVIIELTEHAAVEDYPQLSSALLRLRETGVRLAIDDTGAGFASLMHILKLAPDFIKLDRELVSGIDSDPVRRSLAHSLMRFSEETGALLIAEGVETATELAALRDLGIRRAQGFYLARPGPIEEIARRCESGTELIRREAPAGRPGAERAASARRAVLQS